MHRSTTRRLPSASAAIALGSFLAACGVEAPDPTAAALARDRAADQAFRGRDGWKRAVELLAPLVAPDDAPVEDLLRMACAQLAVKEDDPSARAEPFLARAERVDPEHPVVLWCRYEMASAALDFEQALARLRQLLEKLPDDFRVRLALAQTLASLDGEGHAAELERVYRDLAELPPEVTGAWRVTIVYQLGQLLQRSGRADEAQRWFDERDRLDARKVKPPEDPFHAPDTLGAVLPHTPGALERPAPPAFATRYVREDLGLSGVRALRTVTLRTPPLEDLRPATEEVYGSELVATLVALGANGVELAAGPGAPTRLVEHATIDAAPFDRRNHGADKAADPPDDKKQGDRDLDLLVLEAQDGGAALRLVENVSGAWSPPSAPLATLPAPLGPGSLVPVDFDHEGDVDLLVATRVGLRLLRNDGVEGTGGFADATAAAGLPAGVWRAFTEDVDGDQDVDFLLHDPESGRAGLASNERGGRFSDGRAMLPAGLVGRWIVPADLDADGRVDLAAFGTELLIFTRDGAAGWRRDPIRLAFPEAPTGAPQVVDIDLDGALDLVWPVASRPAIGVLAPAFPRGGTVVALGEPFARPHAGDAELAFLDVDGDLDLDFARADAEGVALFRAEGAPKGLALALLGHKDNARGVGAVLELRSGPLYQRRYVRGTPELVGFGGHSVDMARVTWPNGVRQGDWELGHEGMLAIAQWPGQGGSCPLLYTWNGTTYEFVSDVLVRGEQLVARDGWLDLQITEELREVTYLDRLRLDAVDHPAEVEVFPNERFTFPPFPEAHTHTIRDALAPLRALDQDGRDWTAELAADDRRLAVPFERLAGQYRGLATPHVLELTFDEERVRAAPRLRLVLRGWFVWTDASTNLAAARSPDVEFVAPLLSVPDGNGGWTERGPIGFPAGKLKTMVLDVTDALRREDPRLRLSSTLCLYWDSIRLAVDADDAPRVTTALEPGSARLWLRGFSSSFGLDGRADLEWFEWARLEPFPRWDAHPGLYTRLGDVLPLVTAIDDRFVILGAGDALAVRFDARTLPPLPVGWRRDYLLFLDGWAKDRDPSSVEALYVEPLPFHGMSGYPYRPEERYPDDEAHRAYRREWNTRPATRWVEPLAPLAPPAGGRATSVMPARSSAPAATTGALRCSPSTSTPAAPATSGWRKMNTATVETGTRASATALRR